MRKTSVYLPEDLKTELTRLAARWRRSEADLIRLAVERLVQTPEAAQAVTPPAAPTRRGPLLLGVGVGPGDPRLLTLAAEMALRSAGRVFAISTATDAIGRAETVVRAAVPDVRVDRLPFAVTTTPKQRDTTLRGLAKPVIDALDEGHVVAVVTLGDPNVYSTFPALRRVIAAQRPAVPAETVPGVMAFQELAARTGVVVAEAGDRVVLFVADEHGLADVGSWLEDPTAAVVMYKGGRHLPALAGALERTHRLDTAVIGELLGVPGERTSSVAAVADRPASYLATVVVPARR